MYRQLSNFFTFCGYFFTVLKIYTFFAASRHAFSLGLKWRLRPACCSDFLQKHINVSCKKIFQWRPQQSQQARRTIFARMCKEGGISQRSVDINLTFGFLRVLLNTDLPKALTLPSTIREIMSTFLAGRTLPSTSDKAL